MAAPNFIFCKECDEYTDHKDNGVDMGKYRYSCTKCEECNPKEKESE